MKVGEFPDVALALAYLGADIGAYVNHTAEVPEKWLERFDQANTELEDLTNDQIENLAIGEETEQQQVAKIAPITDAILHDAFDGDLGDVVFTACESAYEALQSEAEAGYIKAARKRRKSEGL